MSLGDIRERLQGLRNRLEAAEFELDDLEYEVGRKREEVEELERAVARAREQEASWPPAEEILRCFCLTPVVATRDARGTLGFERALNVWEPPTIEICPTCGADLMAVLDERLLQQRTSPGSDTGFRQGVLDLEEAS